MAFEIVFTALASGELAAIRPFDRRRITEDIDSQLSHNPDVQTRRKKRLKGFVTAPFEFNPPLWELKVEEFRAFYDVDSTANRVVVRSVRHKPPDKTTEDVLHETGDA